MIRAFYQITTPALSSVQESAVTYVVRTWFKFNYICIITPVQYTIQIQHCYCNNYINKIQKTVKDLFESVFHLQTESLH